MLGYLFPGRAALFAAKAEEAMQVRLRAGRDHPDAVEAGRAIGRRVAALAIARGAADRSDAKWSGSVPEGAGKWKGQNPIAPMAGTWQPWVLAHASELRPPAPPAFDSVETKAALAELKAFARTPKTNHRATFWEVNGGARAHLLWNEIARTKLLESGAASATAARAASDAQRRDERRRHRLLGSQVSLLVHPAAAARPRAEDGLSAAQSSELSGGAWLLLDRGRNRPRRRASARS
jgi:hypothetical protein